MRLLLSVLVVSLVGIFMIPNAFAENVPDWVKNTAGWWASDQITDSAFLQGIQYLIKEGIMVIPPTEVSESVPSQEVPSWVKNNAGWWADDQINDSTFVSGIQYLIKSGIIVVTQAEKSVTETTVKVSNYPDWLITNPSWQAARILTNSDFNNFDTRYLKEKPSKYQDVHINSHGFRGPEFSEQKPENTYRIFALGGSTTFGHSLADDETWSAYLQKKFDQTDLKFNVEVINAGINKANSRTELKLIEDRLVDFGPDLVIMYDGWNDASCNVISNPAYCLEQFDSVINASREEDLFDSNVHSMKKSVQTLQNWKSVCKLGNEKGFDTIITVQPIVGTGNRVPTNDILAQFPFYGYHDSLHYGRGDFIDEPFYKNANKKPSDLTWMENMYPKLSLYVEYLDQLKEHCTKVADFRAIFDYIQEPIYYDPGHVVPLGNQILAEHFFAMILSILHEDLNKHANSNYIPNYNYIPSTDGQLTPGNFVGPLIADTYDQITHYAPNVELRGKNFEGLDLKNAVFYYSDLTGSNFQNANLSNAFFYRANLKNVNFQGADLSDADFGLANIEGANFQDANLDGTQFYHVKFAGIDISNANNVARANLSHSNLSEAILTDIDLSSSDLSFTNLSRQDLSDKDLTKTILLGADFTNAILPNALSGKNFTNAIFNGVNLSGKDMSDSDFSHSKIDNTNLENANLTLTMFVDVDLTKIKNKSLAGADLSEASFTHSNLSGVNLSGVILDTTNFWKTNLSGVDFTVTDVITDGLTFIGANLSNSNFEGVDLSPKEQYFHVFENKAHLKNLHHTLIAKNLFGDFTNIILISTEVRGNDLAVTNVFFNNFAHANLENANFKNAKLWDVNFYSANLTNADLSGANLSKAILSGTDLSNANLEGTNLQDAILDNAILTGANLNCINHPICNS